MSEDTDWTPPDWKPPVFAHAPVGEFLVPARIAYRSFDLLKELNHG